MRRSTSLTGNVRRIRLKLAKRETHGRTKSPLSYLLGTVGCLIGTIACVGSGPCERPPIAPRVLAVPESARHPTVHWPDYTQSPGRRRSVEAVPGCQSEERLDAVAQQLAKAQANGEGRTDLSEVVFLLRAAGIPHVDPRYWSVEGPDFRQGALQARLRHWLGGIAAVGQLRCGVGVVTGPTAEGATEPKTVLVGLALDVMAELEPFPTRVRPGQLLTMRARGLVDGTEARLILLGPTGPPRSVGAGSRIRHYRSSFRLTQPGLWKVQLVARQSTGPRPFLEAWVSVGEPPPQQVPQFLAPGEEHGRTSVGKMSLHSAREQLLQMINATRARQLLPPLHRTVRLDRVAQEHAEAMRSQGTTAHDVGGGGPEERLKNAGISARVLGENVAQAGSLALAHRALYNSPSHRQTLLHPPFRQVGIGVSWARSGIRSTASSPDNRQRQPAVLMQGKLPPGDVGSRPSVQEIAPTIWVAELFVDHGAVLR